LNGLRSNSKIKENFFKKETKNVKIFLKFMASSTKTHHVKNRDLREELILSKEKDELTPKAVDMIMLMAEKLSTKFKYVYPEDREDCIAFAIMDCWKYWRGYNPEKSDNAFAYITQIQKNGFAKAWRVLKNHMPESKKISISSNNIYSL
jgi:hypothetical protein